MKNKLNQNHTANLLALAAIFAIVQTSPLFAQSAKTNTTGKVSTTTKTNSNESVAFKTVTIGSQVWMAENLNVSTFRNGEPIPEIQSNDAWDKAYRDTKAACCYYDNDPVNGSKYGRLYNWYAVDDPRGLAPKGWHVPTDKEWQTLIATLGGQSEAFSKLKSTSGFAALPAGHRYYKDCSFYHLGNITFWWSATKKDTWNAWYHAMHFGYSQAARDSGGMNTGFSVRCLKDGQESKDGGK